MNDYKGKNNLNLNNKYNINIDNKVNANYEYFNNYIYMVESGNI